MTPHDRRRPSGEQRPDRERTATTRRSFVKAAGAGVAGAGLAVGGTTSAAAEGIPTPWLERDGNLLRDPEGNEVVLRGVNIADPARLNRTDQRYHVSGPEVARRALDESNGWYNRVIRIPCQSGDIAGSGKNEVEPGTMTQSQVQEYVENDLRPVVDTCAEEGAYCIVDYHRHDDAQLLYTDDELDEEVRMFWETVAPEFADDSHVLFEVYNEPIAPYPGHNDYGPGAGVDVASPEAEDTWLTWRDAAQPWVDTIREHAPRNVVIIGSPRWTQWTYWADEHEFEGENLAYAGHVYAHENLRPLSTYFGKPAENVPVFMTEFGYDDEGQDFLKGTTSEEGEDFKQFFEEYDSVHWQVWCFDPRWEPAMFEEDQGEWTLLGGEDFHGEFFKEYLAEKRNDDLPGGGSSTGPSPPSDLWVADETTSSIELAWEPVDGAAGYRVYLGDSLAAEPTDESATIEELAAGTEYVLDVSTVDADGAESTTATITASTATAGGGPCADAAGSETLANDATVCDVDGDGQYMDVTGDGSVTNSDVTEFFSNQHASPWSDRADLFDFDGDENVGQSDVVELFAHVTGQ